MTHVTRITDRDDYETPNALFRPLHVLYRFDVDAAASDRNALCESYFTGKPGYNALMREWKFDTPKAIWCNPPFSKKEEFLAQGMRFRNFNRVICFLLPANAPETAWWRYMVFEQADQIIYLTPRVNFNLNGEPTKGVTFPSCLALYYPRINGAVYTAPAISCWSWKNED